MQDQRYSIKIGYKARAKPHYFDDGPESTITWQPDVYKLARILAKRTKAKYIIDIGSGNGKKLVPFRREFKIIAVDFGSNLLVAKKNIGGHHRFIEQNFEQRLLKFEQKVLEKSIVICADVIEHIIKPDKLLRSLQAVSLYAPYVLISTPDRTRTYGINNFGPPPNKAHVREWNLEELSTLFVQTGFKQFIAGHTFNNDVEFNKSTSLIISGTQSTPIKAKDPGCCIVVLYTSIQKAHMSIGYYYDNKCDVLVIDRKGNKAYYHCHDNVKKNYVFEGAKRLSLQDILQKLQISNCWLVECWSNEKVTSINSEFKLAETLNWISSLGYSSASITGVNISSRSSVYMPKSFRIINSNAQIRRYPYDHSSKTFPLNLISCSEQLNNSLTGKIKAWMSSKKTKGEVGTRGYMETFMNDDYMVELLMGESYKGAL